VDFVFVLVNEMSVILHTYCNICSVLFDLGVHCSSDTDDISCSVHRVCITKANTGMCYVNIENVVFYNSAQV
jgi:hypothetical protein